MRTLSPMTAAPARLAFVPLLSALLLLLLPALAAAAEPLPGGVAVRGVDGTLAADPNAGEAGGWVFVPDTAISAAGRLSPAGKPLPLLEVVTLEEVLGQLESITAGLRCRLWGRVTSYRGKNFLFPIRMLRLAGEAEPAESDEPEGPKINEPGDAFEIPEHIIKSLGATRIARGPDLIAGESAGPERVITARGGFIVVSEKGAVFVPDGLGRNIEQIRLELLPCEALERAEEIINDELEPVRFSISGILTRFRGQYRLLLQRVVRLYSYGNFSR